MNIYELVSRVAKYFGYEMDNVTKVNSDKLSQPAIRPPLQDLIFQRQLKI